MGVKTIMIDFNSNNSKVKKMSAEDIAKCDEFASKYLFLDEISREMNRQIIPSLMAVYYSQPGEDGASLLVCRDGSILYARVAMNVTTHVKAFKEGLRSNKKMLDQLLAA